MSTITYRPAIDGLRALAIIGVYIFHLNHHWLPGGFVGVDVFFVISGFLITSIIAEQCSRGTFKLYGFYERRIARIFPAYLFCSVCTIIAAKFLYAPQDFASAGINLTMSTLSLSNMKSMLQGGYFQVLDDALPFLHNWSLSVEEQFYMIYPLLISLTLRWRRTWVGKVVFTLATVSFILCIIVMKKDPIWAFFLLPTRGWELLTGALLAFSFQKIKALPNLQNLRWAQLLGFIGILVSFVVVPGGKQFPGFWALLPVVSTALVLLPAGEGSPVEKWLASPLIRPIGWISYSLYLWHWPVFSFVDYSMPLKSEGLRLALKLSLSIVGALVSYLVVERPLRIFITHAKRKSVPIGAVALASAACIFIGLQIRRDNYVNAEVKDVKKGGLHFGKKGAPVRIALIGDSNASMYGKLLKDVVESSGQEELLVLSCAGEDGLPVAGKSKGLWQDGLKALKDYHPTTTILASRWDNKLKQDPDRLKRAVDELAAYTGSVVLITQPPLLPENGTREDIRNGAAPVFAEAPADTANREKANAYVVALASDKVKVMDVYPMYIDEDHRIPFYDPKGRQIFHDHDHLSGFGCERLESKIKELIQ